jgi:serine/threonine protein kinase/formylglycine-generating enzyme required for sulfatase activity
MAGQSRLEQSSNNGRERHAARTAIRLDLAAMRLGLIDAYLARFPDVPDVVRDEYAAALAALQDSAAGAERGDGPSTDDGAEGPRLADPYVGRRLGPWKLLRELGRGGQGAVYLAQDERLHRKAAVKVLTATGLLGDALDRFKREATVTSRLDHPGICAVYDVGLEGRTPYIAMRCVEGESLAHRIGATKARAEGDASLSHVELPGTDAVDAEPPPSPPAKAAAAPSRPSTRRTADPHAPSTQLELMKIVRLVEQAARAVHAAHEAGVIHRDLKPGNIMVTTEGEPVVLDFGLAKDISGVEATLTQHGDLMGTPAYMSPEQIAAHRITLDRRTDVYSLGVTLFECLTLQRPFDAPTREGLYQAILTRAVPDPRTLNRAIPTDLRVVLETALDKDRERRYATALDFAEDLRRVRGFEPITARPAGPLNKLARWCRRGPALAASLFGLLAVLTAGLVISAVLLDQKDGALSEANAEREAKVLALNDFERLAVVSRLKALEDEREDVWPLTEGNHPRRKEWLALAEKLAAELPQLEAVLERMRTSGETTDASDLAAQERKASSAGHVDLTFGALAPPSEAEESQPTSRPQPRRWRFADAGLQFKHDVLSAFVEDLRRFVTSNRYHRKLVGMRRQDRESDRFLALMNGEHRPLWNEAVASIRDTAACPLYNGLRIRPQFGLVPIGRNPQSGLWEFMDLGTCADTTTPMPARRSDGGLHYDAEHGVVFVLLPGGEVRLGHWPPTNPEAATSKGGDTPSPDPDRRYFDARAARIRSATFDPFMIAKFEITVPQWRRIAGHSNMVGDVISYDFADGKWTVIDSGHTNTPVSSANWYASVDWVRSAAASLPTPDQWEYACRAGTTTLCYTGSDIRACMEVGWGLIDYDIDMAPNAYSVMPPGLLRPNSFGLFDLYGNASEWCMLWPEQGGRSGELHSSSGGPNALFGYQPIMGGGVGCSFDYVTSFQFAEQSASAFCGGLRPVRGVLQQ